MFEPAALVGMLIGLVVIGGATFLLVRGYVERERDEAERAESIGSIPPEAEHEDDGEAPSG